MWIWRSLVVYAWWLIRLSENCRFWLCIKLYLNMYAIDNFSVFAFIVYVCTGYTQKLLYQTYLYFWKLDCVWKVFLMLAIAFPLIATEWRHRSYGKFSTLLYIHISSSVSHMSSMCCTFYVKWLAVIATLSNGFERKTVKIPVALIYE